MADNVPVTPGTGADIATDDVGGVHYQIVKLAFGPLDTASVVEDASTKRFPVKIAEAIPAGTNNIGDVDIATLPPETVASGSLTGASQDVTMTLDNGMSAVGVQVTGTWTGQLEFEASVDGTNYESHDMVRSLLGTIANATVGNGIFFAGTAGFSKFRVRASALSSGTAVVTVRSAHTPQSLHLESALPTGTNNIGLVQPAPLAARVQVTPTISSGSAYASGDVVGGLQTISNAVRAAGGSGIIQSITVLDKTQAQRAPFDILFFDRSVTVAADNAPVAMSDADMAFCLGVVSIGPYNTAWPGTPLNSISTLINVGLPIVCNGTDLFAVAVVRSGPTYTSTSDLIFSYTILKD